MNTDKILELLFYTLPAIITGGVAYYFFQMFMQNEDRKRRFVLMRDNRKETLPLKLQAYERMTLFLERIDPSKLLIRVTPISEEKNDYVNYVIAQIEQEYEHNLTQQIYVSDECWGFISTAKNATIQVLRKAAVDAEITGADKFREKVIGESFDNPSPSSAALAFVRSEVRNLI
jgi:hypothetical protein